ncbi:hypothetical protein [Synechococcus sp. CS-1328]|uniref:hypothetical protein n=1 Tax=Synechococcus sp. CS-1328 TaxID=2847976 RepID=UPI00223C341B|nr:hypothetical protein [Synechococcus sp. CS-1328]MCT0225697.1 hypothetical protein [Synechococcus sp. CS-1328]
MAIELLIALVLPVVLLITATLLLESHPGNLPRPLGWLRRRQSLIWNSGIGLILGLSALRYLLTR